MLIRLRWLGRRGDAGDACLHSALLWERPWPRSFLGFGPCGHTCWPGWMRHWFRPAGRVTFSKRPDGRPLKSNQKRLPLHPGLASLDFPHSIATPRVAAQGPSMALHRGGRLVLSRHPCRSPLCAAIPFGLLKGAFGGVCWSVPDIKSLSIVQWALERRMGEAHRKSLMVASILRDCSPLNEEGALLLFKNVQTTRSRAPFRRPSVGVA